MSSSPSKSHRESNQNLSIEDLQREVEKLEQQLGDEDPQKIVTKHIKLLHDYNEAKDAAQALMGKLALIQGTTVRQLHEKYALKASD